MEFEFQHDGQNYPLSIQMENKTFSAAVDGHSMVGSAADVSSNAVSFRLGNKAYRAFVVKTAGAYEVFLQGRIYRLIHVAEDSGDYGEIEDDSGKDGKISAAMPGNLVKVYVKAGSLEARRHCEHPI